MGYTPIAQRKTTPTVGSPAIFGASAVKPAYVPVAQRTIGPKENPAVNNPLNIASPFRPMNSSTQMIPDETTPDTVGKTGNLLKEVGQGTARSIASAAVTIAGAVAPKSLKPFVGPLKTEDFQNYFTQGLIETVFGPKPDEQGMFSTKSIEQNIAEAEPRIAEWQKKLAPVLDTPGLSPTQKFVVETLSNIDPKFLAFPAIMGSVGLDLTGFGGLEKNAYKALISAGTEIDAIRALTKMGVADDLVKIFAPDVVKVTTEKEAKALFENIVKIQETTKIQGASRTLYHGTNNPDAIKKGGFSLSKKAQEESNYLGDNIVEGVHLSPSKTPYEEGGQLEDVLEVLEVQTDAKNILKTDFNGIKKLYDKYGIEELQPGASFKLTKALQKEGYEGLEYADEIVIFDPKKVSVKKTEGGIPGNKGLKAVGLAPEPSPKIVRTESQLLKSGLKKEAKGAKAGFKAGYQEAKESIVNQLRNTFDTKLNEVKRGNELATFKTKIITRDADRVKGEIIEYVKAVIPTAEQGKFIVTVKNSKTQKDLINAFIKIDRKASDVILKDSISTLKKTADNLTESSVVSADYRNKIKEIIGQYELTGHTNATIAKLEATQAYLTRVGGESDIPQRILDKLKILTRTPKNKLTLSQVEALQSEIELLGKLGETKWASKEAIYEGEKNLRKQALLGSASELTSSAIPKMPIGEKPSKWVEWYVNARNYLQKSRLGLTPIEGLADITGMQPMKEVLDLSFGNYLVHNEDIGKRWTELTTTFTDSNYERIGTYAISKQKGGLERLANSGLTQAEVEAIKLTPEEMNAYKFVRETFDKEFPAIKKYAMDTYNVDVGEVDNYVSYMSDYNKMSDLEVYDRFGVRADEAVMKTKTVEQGFTKARSAVADNKLELNIDKIFRRHTDDAAYMLNMGHDIKQYFEIVNSPEMREKLGDVGTLAWLQYLDLMARKGGTEGAKRIVALDVLRKNMGAGVLGFRLSSAMVQLTSFSDTVAGIGIEYATKGASNIATSKEWRNFVMDNFPEVRKAMGDDISFREFGDGFLGRLSQTSMVPLQTLDGLMRSTAVAGAYEKLAFQKGIAVNLAKPDKELIAEATKIMRQSQGSSFFKDQPLAITAGWGLTDNKSLNKTILTFQSFMLNRWDNMQRQIWRMGIKEKDYKKAAASAFWMIVFSAAAEEGIRRGVRSVTDFVTGDEREERGFVEDSLLNVVQTVPIAGSLVSSMVYSSNPVPVINTFEELLSGTGSLVNGKTGTTKTKGAVRALGSIGSLTGVPGSSQAAQLIGKAIPEPKKSSPGGGGLPNLPSLPKLPKLPKLSN